MMDTMEVDEIRIELSKRGLDTSGTNRILGKRLKAALLEESNGSKPDGVVETDKGKKRKRENGNAVSNETSKIEKYQAMSIQKLRKAASSRGMLTAGSKKALIQSAACNNGSIAGNGKGKKKAMKEVKKDKLVTVMKKGFGVLDQWLPDNIRSQYHVLKIGDVIYDAMLNQTNVGKNNNKFYVIQVLEKDGGGSYIVYNRWGRVGVKGHCKLFKPHSCRKTAISKFKQKFLAKTKNHWSERNNFVPHPNSYTWIERKYEPGPEDPHAHCPPQHQETKLDQRVAEFISLICNVEMMEKQIMEIGYDAEVLPLGKLSESTISRGYKVLKRIADVIGNSNRKLLEQLTEEFYTVIPHNFGFKKMMEFVIDTPEKLKHELEVVEALREIKLAIKILDPGVGTEKDPLYAQYKRLRCQLVPVDVGSEEFSMIETYTKNTHVKTHSHYTVEIAQVFKVSKVAEKKRFKKFAGTDNRMLLWHGSRLTNWTGILSQGLRIDPPEAPVTGSMFGKGVYFADMFSKSANYCRSSPSAPDGVLLLCEVALGEMNELLRADYNADKLPAGKLSTKGVGGTVPDFSKCRVLKDGVVVPLAKPLEKGKRGSLEYNEYVVYNEDQIRMRYVMQVKFKHRD